MNKLIIENYVRGHLAPATNGGLNGIFLRILLTFWSTGYLVGVDRQDIVMMAMMAMMHGFKYVQDSVHPPGLPSACLSASPPGWPS